MKQQQLKREGFLPSSAQTIGTQFAALLRPPTDPLKGAEYGRQLRKRLVERLSGGEALSYEPGQELLSAEQYGEVLKREKLGRDNPNQDKTRDNSVTGPTIKPRLSD